MKMMSKNIQTILDKNNHTTLKNSPFPYYTTFAMRYRYHKIGISRPFLFPLLYNDCPVLPFVFATISPLVLWLGLMGLI